MKYYYKKKIGRKRIADPELDIVEMHRNVRVELYPEEIANKIKDEIDLSILARYPDVDLLSNKLSKYHGVKEENVLITSGIDGGIKTIFEMCTKSASKIVCITPTYAMYQVYANAYNVDVVSISSKIDFSIDVDEILKSMNQSIDIVFIPNPHIPIEYTFSRSEIERILECAKQHEILVVIDEAYYMFGAPTMLDLIFENENFLVARTFSKGLGLPSIRLGYLVGNEKIISYLSSRRFAHETNSLTCGVAVWVLDNLSYFQSYIDEVIDSREWVKNELNKLGIKFHGSNSNSILLDLETSEKAKHASSLLRKYGYVVKSNIPRPFERCLLFTVGTKNTMKKFTSVLVDILDKMG